MARCTCVYADYDPVEFYHETERKARVTHKCHECLREIAAGEKYLDCVFKDGHDPFTKMKVCAVCGELIQEFFCEGYCFGLMREQLWEHVQDHQGVVSEKCITALSSAARQVVFNIIESVWKQMEEDDD